MTKGEVYRMKLVHSSHAKKALICFIGIIFSTAAIHNAASPLGPETRIPKTKYLSQIPAPTHMWVHEAWIRLLIGHIIHVATENHLMSRQEVEEARQFLRIVDIPEAIQPDFTQSEPKTILTSASRALCCALLLLDQAARHNEPANGPDRIKAKNLLTQMLPKYSESKNPQDRLAVSYADLLLALVSGTGTLPYSESDLIRINRQYNSPFPERAMMAQSRLAQLYSSQGKTKEAKAIYNLLVKEYPRFKDCSIYIEADLYIKTK